VRTDVTRMPDHVYALGKLEYPIVHVGVVVRE
jgi:hypothetical protein